MLTRGTITYVAVSNGYCFSYLFPDDLDLYRFTSCRVTAILFARLGSIAKYLTTVLAFVSAGYLPMYPCSMSDGYLPMYPLLYPFLYPSTLLYCSNCFPALWHDDPVLPLRRVSLRIPSLLPTKQFTTAFSIVSFSKPTTSLSDSYLGRSR